MALGIGIARGRPISRLPLGFPLIEGRRPSSAHLVADYKEWYLPLTRRQLIEQLLWDDRFCLSRVDRGNLKCLAAELDLAASNKYHEVLHDLKRLYLPVNPDKEAIVSTRGGGSDTDLVVLETRFLTLFRRVLKQANFQQLSHDAMTKALKEHNVGDGVMVSINPHKYVTLLFWVQGLHTVRSEDLNWLKSFQERIRTLTGRPTPKEQTFYSRVVVAVRKKGSKHLRLKGYKDVPVSGLEQLLPDGKVRMGSFDRWVLVSMCLLGSASLAARTSAQMTSMNIKSGALISLVVSGLIGFNSYFAYGNRRNSYLLELSGMHYYRNLANNLALVTMLVDRAQDEIFKEALVVYALLSSGDGESGASLVQLERMVESLADSKLNQSIKFDSREAVDFLLENKLVMRRGHLIFSKNVDEVAQESTIKEHRYLDI